MHYDWYIKRSSKLSRSVHPLFPCPLSCSELLRSSCKSLYRMLRCLWLFMNFFKSNWCQDFMLWWLEWQISRFSSFWPLLSFFIMKNKSWKNHRKVRKIWKKNQKKEWSDLTKNWSCTSRLSISGTPVNRSATDSISHYSMKSKKLKSEKAFR